MKQPRLAGPVYAIVRISDFLLLRGPYVGQRGPVLPTNGGGLVAGKEVTMKKTYERPTLTAAGSFKQLTGLGGTGPKDAVTKKQSL